MTPSPVRFSTGECWLGSFLVATTERGICALTLSDAPGPLTQEIRARYPEAERADAGHVDPSGVASGIASGVAARVRAVLEDPSTEPGLPLDLQGTSFQLRVWRALQQVAPGERVTYSELARRIGSGSAVRAVAAACGANPVAVLVPCHRVIGKDGGLRGYRWGVGRKRALLERERLSTARGTVQDPLPGF
ncbi:MAG TPA: methylated-DNA--[protein]-cysteine S-methyltransferase [Trueperaceae bacterium]|nr:methylated-DNA--[protein]-cysteine S-methyltransferase [Trueperaceae bacterium]